jgi:sugar porter (SP) family MFS transporter
MSLEPSAHAGPGPMSRGGALPPRLWSYLIGALGGLLFGYDTGIIAGAILFLRKDFALDPMAQGLVVSSLVLGALAGAATTGYLSDRFGRRRLLLLAGAVYAAGAIGAALAPSATVLIGFRLLLGLAVGVSSVLVPLYLAEMAPTSVRGALTSLNQLMIALGIFVSYLVTFALSSSGDWRLMLGLAAVPAAFMLIGLWFQDESPRWLIAHGRTEEARAVLARTQDPAEAERELAEIERVRERGSRLGILELLRNRGLRRGMLLAAMLAVFQQLVGINTIVYYAPTILSAAGFGDSAALLNSVGLASLSIIATLIAASIVDRVGRRPLMLGGLVGMLVSMAALGAVFSGGGLHAGSGEALAVTCLAAFKIAFSLSWGPLVWVMLPELLPLQVRGTVMGGAVFLNWAANFLVSLFFPIVLAAGAGVAFELFAGLGVFALVLTARWLPETTGRSLEAIELEQLAENECGT